MTTLLYSSILTEFNFCGIELWWHFCSIDLNQEEEDKNKIINTQHPDYNLTLKIISHRVDNI